MQNKKIIAAIDGLKYSESTPRYTTYIAGETSAHVVGVLLEDALYTSFKIYELVGDDGLSGKRLKKFENKDKLLREAARNDLEEAFRKAGIEYSIHRDRNYALQELVYESIYADMMIIDAKENLSHHKEKVPTRFIRDLLTDVQCPVMVVPRQYEAVQKVIVLYDGEPSSVHAAKMFSYLLPFLKELDTTVISVNPPKATLHLAGNKLMKEFMKCHYPGAKYMVVKGRAEEEIIKYLRQQQNAVVVLGAYRRGAVSRWFRESMADVLMREIQLPLFIAHSR